jgi:hypothetical protein
MQDPAKGHEIQSVDFGDNVPRTFCMFGRPLNLPVRNPENGC